VNTIARIAATALIAGLALSCASGGATPAAPNTVPVPQDDLKEGRKMMGTENDVRVDAELLGETQIDTNSVVPVKFTIENRRMTPIAVADIVPHTTYDPDNRTITVNVGSEVPGAELLPRLIQINPTEKKEFSIGAHTSILIAEGANAARMPTPRQLQLKVNFLGDVTPFRQLINISEKSIHNPQLANELFTKWVEGNETVITNSLPVRWGRPSDTQPPPPPRRRGRG
jgi:hypothetical protein